ncbi:taste receptor type 1 member 1-like [Pholidichthys leucotaenia]
MDCSSQFFSLSDYRRFQVMRFSVEQINNSSSLLPNVSLGYEIFDHCSDMQSFPGIFKLISNDGLIHPLGAPQQNLSKVIAVLGPFTSTKALTVAPLFMVDLFPMVNYGSASSVFSKKAKYPSFLRTSHPNQDTIQVIVNILQNFNWRWVAFLYDDNDYGIDGQDQFIKKIKKTNICLAYTKGLVDENKFAEIFKQIEAQKIVAIVVFAVERTAEAVIEAAILLNVTNKVWIAGETWALSKRLPKENGIKNIGTVLGVSQPVVSIPGFSDFIYSTKNQTQCDDCEQQNLCNQVCNCSGLTAEDIISANPSFSFPIYSAIYAIAHALHKVLQCDVGRCNNNLTVYPYEIFAELKKSDFSLSNRRIQFNENGDLISGSYSIVFWNNSGEVEKIGYYQFSSSTKFYINATKIQWYTDGEVRFFSITANNPIEHN